MADLATNPRARFDYDILETVEAGIVLTGPEVKSIKAGHASIKGAYVKILNGTPWLIGASVPPYQPGNAPKEYRERADRKLLLSKQQTAGLIGLAQAHGVTLVPIRLYIKRKLIKLEIGVARGKKKYDKREAIKKKDVQRSKERGTYEE
ncbi:MAG: SsrA-binding protein SmpB [Candidatus Yanofskybacteria bacterium]|nr:SsrA-binding protein SmpB [Candidatus Yanofskybacteria bacterium]